ncbi:membrane protein [Spirochaetia bacterium]|nr:membrane protein [Spirochaetia bacterium]
MVLDRYLVRQFLPIFTAVVYMFVLSVSLIDLFTDLYKYINYEVPLSRILLVSYYYLPKSLSYALPISLLFASAYTLGELYARNELTSIFSSGIPFWRFSLSLVIIGVVASFTLYYLQDRVVVPTFKYKKELSRYLLHQQQTASNSDIVIKARNGQLIYSVDYYDVDAKSLNGISIIEQDEKGGFKALIRAPQATWTGEYWAFSNPLIYRWEDGVLRVFPLGATTEYRELPDTFRRNAVDAADLPAREAANLVEDLKSAGLPFLEAQADYYHRFSFSAVPFVVMILSISMGGRFKKNILLMSLLVSLVASVVFYVMEMISMMMARLGYIPPIVGAWFPIVFFSVVGVFLLRGAKT